MLFKPVSTPARMIEEEIVTVKLRDELHISRKIFHASGVFFLVYLFNTLTRVQSLTALVIAAVTIIGFDFLRLKYIPFHNFALKYFRRIMRDNELEEYSASTFLVLGVLTVVAFFPPVIVSLSLSLLALGDPLSSIFGVKYGKDKIIGNKSLQGSLAGFIVCTLVGFVYYYTKGIMLERIILVSILTGLIGTVSELIPIGKADDNFSFPVLAAIMLHGLFILFGGYA